LDILVLGMRGKDDVANGGMLTDTILLFSLDPATGTATLTSIPRDLTVRITNDRTEKINTAYTLDGLDGAKRLFSRVLGVSIDNIAVVDFQAFQSVVDTLGGVTITLDKPFSETQQWAGTASESYVFSLPAGVNDLNGEQALYYARSRYSTSDFDRSRRQMQIIMAIKQKISALNLTQDPFKALQIILAVRQHFDTDLSIFDIGTIKTLLTQQSALSNIKRYQLTTENLLYETTASGTYELLPRDNTLAHIKAFFRNVLTGHPVLPKL
jgi:LCP family protein required for cell wall assembly